MFYPKKLLLVFYFNLFCRKLSPVTDTLSLYIITLLLDLTLMHPCVCRQHLLVEVEPDLTAVHQWWSTQSQVKLLVLKL